MKRQKRILDAYEVMWDHGNNQKLSFMEWSAVLWMINANLLKNFIEPKYNFVYKGGKAKVEK